MTGCLCGGGGAFGGGGIAWSVNGEDAGTCVVPAAWPGGTQAPGEGGTQASGEDRSAADLCGGVHAANEPYGAAGTGGDPAGAALRSPGGG